MSKDEKFYLKVDHDVPGMNPNCYSMSGSGVSIPSEFIVEVDKCIFVQAEEIFANNRNISSFVFPAKIYSTFVEVEYDSAYLEFVNWGNGEQIYAVFTDHNNDVEYRVDILGVVIEATSQENERKSNTDDLDNRQQLFSEGPFQKCLRVNREHLLPKVYDKLVAEVEVFNLKCSGKSHITLFNIPTAYSNTNSNGLGVLLDETPWTNENLIRKHSKNAEDVLASLKKLGLPDNFINIIWQAGCAGAEVVIFEDGGVTFEQLPVF